MAITEYNANHALRPCGLREAIDAIREAPELLRHAFLGREPSLAGARWRVLLCILYASVYLLSPFDLLPEAFFGPLGLLDDAIVILHALLLAVMVCRTLTREYAEGQRRTR